MEGVSILGKKHEFLLHLFASTTHQGPIHRHNVMVECRRLASLEMYRNLFGRDCFASDSQCATFLSTLVNEVYAEKFHREFQEIEDALKATKNAILHANIRKIAKHAHLPLGRFHVADVVLRDGTSVPAIKVDGVFLEKSRHVFGSTAQERAQSVLNAIHQSIEAFSSFQEKAYVFEQHITTRFLSAQRCNQALLACRTQQDSIASKISKFIKIPSEIAQNELAATTSCVLVPAKHDTDQPKLKGAVLRYPGDDADHYAEGRRIFCDTQAQRLRAYFDKESQYWRGSFEERSMHSGDLPLRISANAPSSYWIGHASCLISLPLRDKNNVGMKTFTLLTDPVEGNLVSFLYPRMTTEGRKIKECPAVHVMLLSHNHLDHYKEATVQKLLSLQPVMLVPDGDGKRLQALGFTKVYEQKWWDEAKISFASEGREYEMSITAVPSHHWAGRGFVGGESSFHGYVIRGAQDGDIYYAGDTARLNEEHIKKLQQKFRIMWMFQPGGPDENRADMESSHQSSADCLWMHMRLFLEKQAQICTTKPEFLEACMSYKTILMHTMTFQLGNLHADDTENSIKKVLHALPLSQAETLAPYEQKVWSELRKFCENSSFGKEQICYSELAQLLRETVFVPTIGSRIDFEKSKQAHRERMRL